METEKDPRPKRPYERPTLVPSSIFGAEAMTGSCCRGGACNNAVRSAQQTSIDPSKVRSSAAS